jgi:hypothetical protein
MRRKDRNDVLRDPSIRHPSDDSNASWLNFGEGQTARRIREA